MFLARTMAWSLLWLSTTAAVAQPIRPQDTLQERTQARAYTVRLRIEPTWREEAGRCLGLGLADLRVSLRGRPVTDPQLLDLDRERPPTVHALLVDTSGSMRGKLERARRAASEYVDWLRPEQDKALLVGFAESVLLEQAITSDRETLHRAIQEVRPGVSTSLLDGLIYTIRELDVHRERPVVVLLTDGVDWGSLNQRDDVYDLVAGRPDLTVFAVGVGLPPIQSIGPSGINSSKRFLQRLAIRTNGKFFDAPTDSRLKSIYRRIREMLDNEATLTVIDPEPQAEPGRLTVKSRADGCRVKRLRTRTASPARDTAAPVLGPFDEFPTSLVLAPDPLLRKVYTRSRRQRVDPACRDSGWTEDEPAARPDGSWRMIVGQDGLDGCALDVTMDYGLLYDPFRDGWIDLNVWIKLETRAFEVPLPPLADLPDRPELLLERLAGSTSSSDAAIEIDPRRRPRSDHARPYHDYAGLLHGRVFFALRPRLARALYLHEDYREWARARLRDEAASDLETLRGRFRRRAPGRSERDLTAAVHQSEEGRRILARAETPSEADLQRHLAAWLGDIPAHELFERWEAERIDRLLARRSNIRDRPFAEDWAELRRVFFVPSYTRVLTLLSPARDPQSGSVGYWRIVLPRPGWLQRRAKGYTRHPELSRLPMDLIPDLPLAFWTVRRLLESSAELAGHLRQRGYRVDRLDYELLGRSGRHDPLRAFGETRVSVAFRAGSPEATRSFELVAEVSLRGKRLERTPRLDGLEISVVGDPDLRALLRSARATLAGPAEPGDLAANP